MATVHFGRLLGPVGFARTVAIKRLHPQHARDPEFVSMFLDEARLVARIHHPNVVQTLDVVALDGELLIVMDYVQGEALWRLLRTTQNAEACMSPLIATSILTGTLYGLHAAHEARGERGEALNIVHRDVSPQNILVGIDGVSRVLDFGVAKAVGRIHSTQGSALKGKLAYMAPEQLEGKVSRQTDIFAASIVLWEALTCERLFSGTDERETVGKILSRVVPPPSELMGDWSKHPAAARLKLKELDKIVLKGLKREPTERFSSAREMAMALEKSFGVATPAEVSEWVETTAKTILSQRAETVAMIESSSSSLDPHSEQLRAALRAASSPETPAVDVVFEPTRTDGLQGLAKPDDLPSQLSSISLSKEPPASKNPRRWATIGMAALISTGLAIGAFLLAVRSKPVVTNSAPPSSRETEAETSHPTASAVSPSHSLPEAAPEYDAGRESPPPIPSSAASATSAIGTPVMLRPKRSTPPPATTKAPGVESVIDTRK
jgi:eukaryotic-like serine/threonine-protein kinase